MSEYNKLAHTVYDCRYHIVWITKYRFRVIDKEIKTALKWSIKQVCDWKGIEIIEGSISEEHIHLYLQIPPKYSISDAVKWIKGKSSEKLLKTFPKLNNQYWGRHLWARGYFVSTVGISDKIIKGYIAKHNNQESQEFMGRWK